MRSELVKRWRRNIMHKRKILILLALLLFSTIAYSKKLDFVCEFGNKGSDNGQFNLLNEISSLISFDNYGNIYILDDGNNRVQKLDSNGKFIFKFGEYGDDDGKFNSAFVIKLDNYGNIYVLDYKKIYLPDEKIKKVIATCVRLQKFDKNGNFLNSIIFSQGENPGEINERPTDFAVDSNGNIYILEKNKSRVQKFDSDGNFIFSFGKFGEEDGYFANPNSVLIDGEDNIYICDSGNYRIQKFGKYGNFLLKFGKHGRDREQFYEMPYKIFIDERDIIYVLSNNPYLYPNKHIQIFNHKGKALSPIIFSYDKYNFIFPSIIIDNLGNVYLIGTLIDSKFRIKKFSQTSKFQWVDFNKSYSVRLNRYDSISERWEKELDKIEELDYKSDELRNTIYQHFALSYPFNEKTNLSIYNNIEFYNIDYSNFYFDINNNDRKTEKDHLYNSISINLAHTKYFDLYRNIQFIGNFSGSITKEKNLEIYDTTQNLYKPKISGSKYNFGIIYGWRKSNLSLEYYDRPYSSYFILFTVLDIPYIRVKIKEYLSIIMLTGKFRQKGG